MRGFSIFLGIACLLGLSHGVQPGYELFNIPCSDLSSIDQHCDKTYPAGNCDKYQIFLQGIPQSTLPIIQQSIDKIDALLKYKQPPSGNAEKAVLWTAKLAEKIWGIDPSTDGRKLKPLSPLSVNRLNFAKERYESAHEALSADSDIGYLACDSTVFGWTPDTAASAAASNRGVHDVDGLLKQRVVETNGIRQRQQQRLALSDNCNTAPISAQEKEIGKYYSERWHLTIPVMESRVKAHPGWDPALGLCAMPQVLAVTTYAAKTMILCPQLFDGGLPATLLYFKNNQKDLKEGTTLDEMLSVVGAFGHEMMHFIDWQIEDVLLADGRPAYGYTRCVALPGDEKGYNADNYQLFMTASWLDEIDWSSGRKLV